MESHELTIIIPSLHPSSHELSRRALDICQSSLRATFSGQVIIALNGEDSSYPQGQCTAVNRIASEVTNDWIMVSNNDMVYPPHWFEKMAEAMENFGLLVASPNLVEPRKGAPPFIEKFCGGLGTVGTKPDFDKYCFLDFANNYKENSNRPLAQGNLIEDGFNLPFIIRKDVWDTIGGYDTAYDPWGSNSDSDLQYKVMTAGITPKRVREVLVYHFSQTSGTSHPDHRDAWEKNSRYFKDKWGVERASSPDIWYKPSLEGVTFNPEWEGKYDKV